MHVAVVGLYAEVPLSTPAEESLWRAVQKHVLEEESYHVRYQMRIESEGLRIQPGQCVVSSATWVAASKPSYRIVFRKAGYKGDILQVSGIEGGVVPADLLSQWWGPLDMLRTLEFPACHMAAEPAYFRHGTRTTPMQLGEWVGGLAKWGYEPKTPPQLKYAVLAGKGDTADQSLYCPVEDKVLDLVTLNVPVGLDRGDVQDGWWQWYRRNIYNTYAKQEADNRPTYLYWEGEPDNTRVDWDSEFTDPERECHMDPIGLSGVPKLDWDTTGHQWDSFVRNKIPLTKSSANMFTPLRQKLFQW
jgi:hypothetical protein